MIPSAFKPPIPENEPKRNYTGNLILQEAIETELKQQTSVLADIPMSIGGQDVRSGHTAVISCPHDHRVKLGVYHRAGNEHVEAAIEAARKVSREWSSTPWNDRAAIFLKAAEMLSGKYRTIMNVSTMLGQSKTIDQAELDAACELIDFWRFNAWFSGSIVENQPEFHTRGTWNTAVYRPLEGFTAAITPFNFTAIAGNLPTAPALMGNVVVWKPAGTAVLSAGLIMRILKEAGLPDGVINMLPCDGEVFGNGVFGHRDFAGLHFTGSTDVFNSMWKRIGLNLSRNVYRNYPRIVGETGGKGFVIAAPDAHLDSLTSALFRGAFEYQGQKCSAASRAYIPKSIWPEIRERLQALIASAKIGDVSDLETFMGAVIDESAYNRISTAIVASKKSVETIEVIGGEFSSSEGWFIHPAVVVTRNPQSLTMIRELFGPVLSVYVYEDHDLRKILETIDFTSAFALTGSIFARDRLMIRMMISALEFSAGNLYINDKPTGAVVGQQAFGGSRASGTNDKAGSILNLLRWTNVQVIKEQFREAS